jgi:hypothetical protein
MDEGGLVLDVGSYCKGLEYATGVKARIIGKPSKDYFLTAVKDLGLQPDEVMFSAIYEITKRNVGGFFLSEGRTFLSIGHIFPMPSK